MECVFLPPGGVEVDSRAAKRFIRSALWEPEGDKQDSAKSKKRKMDNN